MQGGGLKFRGGIRSGPSPNSSSDLGEESFHGSSWRSACHGLMAELGKLCKGALRSVDLRFDSREDEAAFKASLEPELLNNALIGTCFMVFCWVMCFLETCDQEAVNISSLPLVLEGDVKAVYLLILLFVVALCCASCLVLVLRLKFDMCRNLHIELFSLVVILPPLAVCIFCNKWHIPFYFGKHPDAIWAMDRRGEEALVMLDISAVTTAWVTYMPIRTCVLWILPVSYCSMYIMAAVIVGPTFLGYSSQCAIIMMVMAYMLFQGACRIEKRKRDDWLVTEKQKQKIETQELQISQEIKIATCAEAICESMCDIVLRLRASLYLFRESRTATAFFGKDLLAYPFTDILCSSDVGRFKGLLERVDAGALPQCLPVTMKIQGKSVNSSLIVLSTGVSEPKYLISIRCDQRMDFEDEKCAEEANFKERLPDLTAATTYPGEEDSMSFADDSVSMFEKQVAKRTCFAEGADAPGTWEDEAASTVTFKTVPKGMQEMCSFKPAVGLGMGNYTLIKTAGRGSQASVFQVKDEMGQCFALKRISLLGTIWQQDFPDHLASWDREVRSLKSLSWAAEVIVQIHEAWVQSDFKVACVVMEWVPVTLAQVVDKRFRAAGRVSPQEMSNWVVQIAFGIAAIHSIGWIHRDIKTNNMLLSEDEKCCKVADLGIGRPTRSRLEDDSTTEVESVLTSYTENRGTPAYMSPEALAPGGHYGKPADIFGLGCILLEMLIGKDTFLSAAERGMSMQTALAMLEVVDVRECMKDDDHALRSNLNALSLQMLAEDAESRPTAAMILANEFLKELVFEITSKAPSLQRVVGSRDATF